MIAEKAGTMLLWKYIDVDILTNFILFLNTLGEIQFKYHVPILHLGKHKGLGILVLESQ